MKIFEVKEIGKRVEKLQLELSATRAKCYELEKRINTLTGDPILYSENTVAIIEYLQGRSKAALKEISRLQGRNFLTIAQHEDLCGAMFVDDESKMMIATLQKNS